MIRCEGLEIIRPVFGGGPVHIAAVVLHQDHVFALADVLRTLEHHVLEQMRKPGAAGVLVVRADVVTDRDGVSGRRVILGKYNPQSVSELVLLDGNLQALSLRLRLNRRHEC